MYRVLISSHTCLNTEVLLINAFVAYIVSNLEKYETETES